MLYFIGLSSHNGVFYVESAGCDVLGVLSVALWSRCVSCGSSGVRRRQGGEIRRPPHGSRQIFSRPCQQHDPFERNVCVSLRILYMVIFKRGETCVRVYINIHIRNVETYIYIQVMTTQGCWWALSGCQICAWKALRSYERGWWVFDGLFWLETFSCGI